MTITFCVGASKREVVEELLGPNHDSTLSSIHRGNTVWAVKQGSSVPYIVCYLLAPAVNLHEGSVKAADPEAKRFTSQGWGYTTLREGPTMPCNCPIDFLLLAPAVDAQWRQHVRNFHARHTKSPVIGEIWSLKHSKIPHVTISAVKPHLEGTYGGHTYRLSLGRLRMPLAHAFSPRSSAHGQRST